MRFVDREKIHIPLFQVFQKTAKHQAFRRDIKEAVLILVQAAQPAAPFVSGKSRVQKRRGDAAGLQRVNLVLHQRDQWRDHDSEARMHQRRQLEAQRLAATGGQNRKHVLSGQCVADDLFLQRPETFVSEVLLEDRKQLRLIVGRGIAFTHAEFLTAAR